MAMESTLTNPTEVSAALHIASRKYGSGSQGQRSAH